ncbi:MAG: hypothetical protein WAU92_18905, partial [Candidatus Sulfotelmatobacter sp.]
PLLVAAQLVVSIARLLLHIYKAGQEPNLTFLKTQELPQVYSGRKGGLDTTVCQDRHFDDWTQRAFSMRLLGRKQNRRQGRK